MKAKHLLASMTVLAVTVSAVGGPRSGGARFGGFAGESGSPQAPPTSIDYILPESRNPSWAKAAENPIEVKVQVDCSLYAKSNTFAYVSLAATTNWGTGRGCQTVTNLATVSVVVKPHQGYTLTLSGTNVDSVVINLIPPPAFDLLRNTRSVSKNPRRYRIYINGKEDYQISAQNPTSCASFTTNYTIEVRPDAGASLTKKGEDFEIADDVAPGDGSWLSLGPGTGTNVLSVSAQWSVELGRLRNGRSAGKLRIAETALTTNSYSPAALVFAPAVTNVSDLEALYDISTGVPFLRQVKAPQAFVDIVRTNHQFDVRFYLPAQVGATPGTNGLYGITNGSPFVTWTVRNPDQSLSITSRLELLEARPEATYTNALAFFNASNTWRLTRGQGSDARTETRAVFIDYTAGDRYETNLISGTTGIVSRTVERYHIFPWGTEIVQTTKGDDALNLHDTFEYYTNASSVYDYSKLKTVTYADGYWEKREYATLAEYLDNPDYYPGSLSRVLRPWKSSPATPGEANYSNCEITAYRYATTYYTKDTFAYDISVFAVGEYVGAAGGSKLDYFWMGNWDDTTTWKTKQGWGIYYSTASSTIDYDIRAGELYDKLSFNKSFNWGRQEASYYDLGTIGTNGQFQVQTTNGLCWRETTLIGRNGEDFGQPSNYYPTGYTCAAIDGHTINTIGFDSVILMPNLSTKTVRVRSQGCVVYEQQYVYTGNVSGAPVFELTSDIRYSRDGLGHLTNSTRLDPITGLGLLLYEADWNHTNGALSSMKRTARDAAGGTATFRYDSLKRATNVTKEGISGTVTQSAIATNLTYDAANNLLKQVVCSGSLGFTNSYSYDKTGRRTSWSEPIGVHSYDYQSGGRVATETLPGGKTVTTERYLDRRTNSVTGTAVVAQFFDYAMTLTGTTNYNGVGDYSATTFTTMHLFTNTSQRWVQQGYDFLARHVVTVSPAFIPSRQSVSGEHYDQVMLRSATSKTASTNGTNVYLIYTGFRFDCFGNAQRQGVTGTEEWNNEAGQFSLLPTASTDRINDSSMGYVKLGSSWFSFTTNVSYLTDNSTNAAPAGAHLQRLTGFTAGVMSEVRNIDANSNETVTVTSVDRANKKVVETETVAQSSLSASRITVNGLLQSESSHSIATPTTYQYDALGRMVQTRTPAGATTFTDYDPVTGQKIATTDFAGNTTCYDYYSSTHTNAGQLKCITRPDGKKTYYAYNLRGQQTLSWGDVPYPEERVYDSFGDFVALKTYRGGSSWNGSSWPASPGTADTTTWIYQESTGLLTNKTDASGRSVSYTYDAANRLRTRAWARGSTVTNIYNSFGDLARLDYNDGTPSIVFPDYNRAGQPRIIIDARGTNTFTYDYASRLVAEIGGAGMFSGIMVSNHFNPVFGRDVVEVKGLSASVQNGYGYDGYGRMGSVTSGVATTAYAYLSDADRLQSTTLKQSGSTVLTTTRAWDSGVRLRSIANLVNSATLSGHSYLYDSVQRRTQAKREDGSIWAFGYNSRDEVSAGKHFWSDWSPVTGQQFTYAYDNIGNRSSAASGGDSGGANLRTTTYGANSLNQYTNVTTAGYEDILGVAIATNSVTVDGNTCDRKGEYFHREIGVSNGSGPLWQTTTVSSGGTSSNGGFVFPKNAATLAYDLDGNLTFDGVWNYRWDGENRLVEMVMTNVSGIPTNYARRLQFTNDFQGRRVSKMVTMWNSSATTARFVYDGWNLVAEVNGSTNALRSYVWGQDLSGSTAGAGGIGGLLVVRDVSAGTNHFAAFDGNGNVTALVAQNGSESARYEYGPFGEMIRRTGDYAVANPLRWSTKFTDEESGLSYYGLRYYSAPLGRWVSRDPYHNGSELPYPFKRRVPDGIANILHPELLPRGLSPYCFIGNSTGNTVDGDGEFLLLDFLMASCIDWKLQVDMASVYVAAYASVVADLAYAAAYTAIVVTEAAATIATGYAMQHPDQIYAAFEFACGYLTPGPPGFTNQYETSGSLLSNGVVPAIEAIIDFITDPNTP